MYEYTYILDLKTAFNHFNIFRFLFNSHGQNQQYSEIEYNRLFVIIPKSDTELDLANTFSKYGEIAKIHIVKKKDTSKSKGIAFITYKK